MRRRLLPPSRDAALAVLVTPKQLGVTRTALLAEAAARPHGVEYGSSRAVAPWSITIRIDRHARTRARLNVGGVPLLNLDHHLLASRDGEGGQIPPGYHWDVWCPLVDRPGKLYIEPQPASASDAVDLITALWYLEFEPERRHQLRWSR